MEGVWRRRGEVGGREVGKMGEEQEEEEGGGKGEEKAFGGVWLCGGIVFRCADVECRSANTGTCRHRRWAGLCVEDPRTLRRRLLRTFP